jgi:hypothetical protein
VPPRYPASEDDLAMKARDSTGDRLVVAPRAPRMLAGLINAATLGLLYALYWRWLRHSGRDAGPHTDAARLGRWLRLFNVVVGILGEQLGSPGGWIVGLRTVDRRTGRRVGLWRTLAVALLGAATEAGRRRLTPAMPPISESEREDLTREARAIRQRYADDSHLQQEAVNSVYEQRRIEVNLWRRLPAIVGPALINSRLRRRLAPTIVVVSRPARLRARRSGR